MKKQDLIYICLLIMLLAAGFLFSEPLFAIFAASIIGIFYLFNVYFPDTSSGGKPLLTKIASLIHNVPIIIFSAIIPIACIINVGTYHADSIKGYIIITGTVSTCFFLLANIINYNKSIQIKNNLLFFYLFFFITLILPNIFFKQTYDAYNYAIHYLIIFIAIFLAINLFKTIIDIKKFLLGILLLLAVIGINSIFEFYGKNIFGLTPIENTLEYGQRILFTFGNPNYLAGFLLITLQLTFSFLFIVRRKTIKLFAYLVFLINIFVLLMTKTKGAIAFCALGLLLQLSLMLYIYLTSNKTASAIDAKKKFYILLQILLGIFFTIILIFLFSQYLNSLISLSIIYILSALIILSIAGIYSGVQSYKTLKSSANNIYFFITIFFLITFTAISCLVILNMFQPDLYSRIINAINNPFKNIEDRIPAYVTALKIWKRSPIIGNGLGSFYHLCFRFFPSDFKMVTSSASYRHVHNEPLEILSEGGILSLTAFIIIIIIVIRRTVRTINDINHSFDTKTLSAGILTIIISSLLYSLFATDFRYISNAYLFYIVIAVGYILPEVSNENKKYYFDPAQTKLHNLKTNNTAILICFIFTAISVFCWHGNKKYFMAEKGIYDALIAETDFFDTYNTTPYYQFEEVITKKNPLYIQFKKCTYYQERINNEGIITFFKKQLNTLDPEHPEYKQAIIQYSNCRHFLEGIYLIEFILRKKCLSWQNDNIYAYYNLAGNYYMILDIYLQMISKWPIHKNEILTGLLETQKESIKYCDKVTDIIPLYKNVFNWKAQLYFLQGMINHEINPQNSSTTEVLTALKYFIGNQKQDIYDLDTNLSILLIYASHKNYKEFSNELQKLFKIELKRILYTSGKSFKISFPAKSDNINIQNNQYSIGEKIIKNLFLQTLKKNINLFNYKDIMAELALSIGDILKHISPKKENWISHFELIWTYYYDYAFKNSSSIQIRKKTGDELIGLIKPKILTAYDNKNWNIIYNLHRQLTIYGWSEIINYNNYDTGKNRNAFIIFWNLKNDKCYDITQWEDANRDKNFKSQYNLFLKNIVYYDILKNSNNYKELAVYSEKLEKMDFKNF